mmetsp:Transcript_7961/g.17110  ORF Transcript_7961/g.17110 Transcript_7961/m.17110 type:complete len:489 (-) Transcript_7961:69-1535(-)
MFLLRCRSLSILAPIVSLLILLNFLCSLSFHLSGLTGDYSILWYPLGIFRTVANTHIFQKRQVRRDKSDPEVFVVNVLDFGAIGNGIIDDTAAVRQTLSYAANLTGELTIIFLENHTFCTGPLNLTSQTTFQVDGTLRALNWTETNWPQIPPLSTYGNSRDDGFYLQYQAFLYAINAHDIRIIGKGMIDGQGQPWWDAAQNDRSLLAAGRPNLVQLVGCHNVEVSGVTLKDSPFWCLHPVLCTNVHIHHMKIRSHMYAFNSDGIDPDSSKNVVIEDSDISCGDDHIAIKAGVCGKTSPLDCDKIKEFKDGTYETVNVTIRRNIFRIGMGISLGSECSGGIRNVRIEDNLVGVCQPGHCEVGCCGWSPALHLKTTNTRGGHMENIVFANNTVYNTTSIILVESGYQDKEEDKKVRPTLIQNLSFQGNHGRGTAKGIQFSCSKYLPCRNVTFLNNNFDPETLVQCENVEVIDQNRNDICSSIAIDVGLTL